MTSLFFSSFIHFVQNKQRFFDTKMYKQKKTKRIKERKKLNREAVFRSLTLCTAHSYKATKKKKQHNQVVVIIVFLIQFLMNLFLFSFHQHGTIGVTAFRAARLAKHFLLLLPNQSEAMKRKRKTFLFLSFCLNLIVHQRINNFRYEISRNKI